MRENVEYLAELQQETERLLGPNAASVIFMKSVSESVKAALLQSARALLCDCAYFNAFNSFSETIFQIHPL